MAHETTALIAKAQKGDETAMNDLIVQCYDDLYYFALKALKDQDLAADITQESCITILQKLNTLKEPGAFKSWTRQIVYHHCTHHFRDTKEILVEENEDGETIFDTLADTDTSVMPEEVAQDKAFQAIMQDLLNELPAQQRTALMLYYYEKMSVSEIAAVQGTTDGTVKSRLNYGRKAVKTKVEEYEKKHDVRLHSSAIVPLLLYLLFRMGKEQCKPVGPAKTPDIVSAAKGSAIKATVAKAAAKGIVARIAVAAGVLITIGLFGFFALDDAGLIPAIPTLIGKPTTGISTTLSSSTTESIAVPTTAKPNTAPTGTAASTTQPVLSTGTTKPTTITPSTSPNHTHSFVLKQDGNVHWNECACGEVRNSNVHTFEDHACTGCGYLLPSEGLAYTYQEATNSYIFTGVGDCQDSTLVIPAQYNGIPVTSIGSQVLYRNNFVTKVIIPDSITAIPDDAFLDSWQLVAVELPEGLTSIGSGAFAGCQNLTDIVLPTTLNTVGTSAFSCCGRLTSIKIPEGVTEIPDNMFSGCWQLANVEFPDSLVSIGESAFFSWFECTSITLPANVKNIGDRAFYDSDLTDIYYKGTKAQWGAVNLGSEWAADTVTVHCTDGDI